MGISKELEKKPSTSLWKFLQFIQRKVKEVDDNNDKSNVFKRNAAHFVFDSEHIDEIQSQLFGFYTTDEGMFAGKVPSEDISDAIGAWVLVKRTSDSIEISQDSIGCFGLFLYRNGSYWALSNSFNRLLDFLKQHHKLSLNKDYARAFLAQKVCISAYGETIIRKIGWLDRRMRVIINPINADLSFRYRKLGERTIPVDTAEGLRVLDAWHDKWASFAQKAAYLWPGKMQVDISGGFDTRMVLAPILSSGVYANRVCFNSHLHRAEDYRIATLLADEFGFSLNKSTDLNDCQLYSPVESFPERSLEAIFFEKETYTPNTDEPRIPTIRFSGFGGETLRNYWADLGYNGFTDIIDKQLPSGVADNKKVKTSIKSILHRSFNSISSMMSETAGTDYKGEVNGLHFYMETRNRSHYGMSIARSCLSQHYNQSILLDPLLFRLRTPINHPNLISALIFTRYHKALASISIEGGRSIPKETLQLAEELNRSFPREKLDLKGNEPKGSFSWSVLKAQDDVLPCDGNSGELKPMKEQLLEAYESPMVHKLFADFFGESPDLWIDSSLDERHPDANKYAIVAIAKALCDIKQGKKAPKDFAAFLKSCLNS